MAVVMSFILVCKWFRRRFRRKISRRWLNASLLCDVILVFRDPRVCDVRLTTTTTTTKAEDVVDDVFRMGGVRVTLAALIGWRGREGWEERERRFTMEGRRKSFRNKCESTAEPHDDRWACIDGFAAIAIVMQ